jgi:hypothetical protein
MTFNHYPSYQILCRTILRDWHSGRASAFQADNRSSILLSRSHASLATVEKPPPFKRMTQGSIPWRGTMKNPKQTAEDLGLVEHTHTETPEEVKEYWKNVDPATIKPVPMPNVVAPEKEKK